MVGLLRSAPSTVIEPDVLRASRLRERLPCVPANAPDSWPRSTEPAAASAAAACCRSLDEDKLGAS